MQNLKDLVEFLSAIITEERLHTVNNVLEDRTRYVTVALEDIYQSQNASAVLRSCDCFGVQDVHIIENTNEYVLNPDVTIGSANWLSMQKYNQEKNNTLQTINTLRNSGYRIVATTPHTNDVTLNEFDLHAGKVALLFGTEYTGLSDIAMENADEFLRIPMFGFTESLNISVSAAIILNQLTSKMRNSTIAWQLSEREQLQIKLNWLMHSIRKPDLVISDYCKRLGIDPKHFIPETQI